MCWCGTESGISCARVVQKSCLLYDAVHTVISCVLYRCGTEKLSPVLMRYLIRCVLVQKSCLLY